MKSCFVDTNLFVRYLTDDDTEKADRVEALLGEASEGRVRLVTADLVLVELIWVLESSYDLKPGGIAPMIRSILATPGMEVINGALLARALDHYEGKSVDIVDGYIAALMEKLNITDVYSFDRKHLSRLKSLKRIEP
ncbi:MAG: type II toxin-antitoxin system VapC family toxin [Deltaproteobacteria bacterium]|nr:type II toxin-antitoxin system VapC family toxin [Deltaproteobacteria bacterium]